MLQRHEPLFEEGYSIIASVDEVGRGALAGPVCVGAISLKKDTWTPPPTGLTDSKLLTQKRRNELVPKIELWAHEYSVGSASAAEIDEIGILAALRLAAERALSTFSEMPQGILIDGSYDWLTRPAPSPSSPLYAPTPHRGVLNYTTTCLVEADVSVPSCSGASVLAKVFRDTIMANLDGVYKGYGLSAHKGYGTKQHRKAIKDLGVTPEHRVSWNLLPVE